MSINQPFSARRLDECPEENGFRLRGAEMTRIEVFVDAAFAFALTMLVIAGDSVPEDFGDMLAALTQVPTFAATFMILMMFWGAHRRWSRRFGLEDATVVWLSGFFVFVMLVWVYPLRMVFAGMFHWISAGWLPSPVTLDSYLELRLLFVFYGAGFFSLSLVVLGLNAHAIRLRDALGLNAVEAFDTRAEMASWILPAGVSLLSVLLAVTLPASLLYLAGVVYFLLAILGPVVGIRQARLRQDLLEAGHADLG